MAWTTSNPVAVGNITKKSQYDALWDNASWLHTTVLGLTSAADTSIDVTFQGGVTHGVGSDDSYLKFEGSSTAADGASIALYGEDHANTGQCAVYVGGDGIAETGGVFNIVNQSSGGNEQLFTINYQYATFGEQVGGTPIILRHHDAAGYLALYGGSSGATGPQFVMTGDDYGGVGNGGRITMRAGAENLIQMEDYAANDRVNFDLSSAGTVYVDFRESDSIYASCEMNVSTTLNVRDSGTGDYIQLYPESGTDKSSVGTTRKALFCGGTETVQIPSATVTGGGTYATLLGATYFENDTNQLWIYNTNAGAPGGAGWKSVTLA